MNYSIRIDLARLCGARFVSIGNKRYIAIPTEENKAVYVGGRGVYLNLFARELQDSKYGDSHFVKENFSSEAYNAMSQEERRDIPILGNLRPFKGSEMNAEMVNAQFDDDLPPSAI